MKPLRIENRATSSRLGWRIEAKANQADVYLYDLIGKDFWGDGTSAADFVQELRNLDVTQIDLHINSPGGYVDDGLAMYNALQKHPATVTAHVDGIAASCASFIAMAADQVLIAPHARMMIHDAQGFVDIFSLANAEAIDDLIKNLASIRDLLDGESDNIAGIYVDKAGGTTSQWRSRMQANGAMGTTYRGQEAVDVGLADAVEEIVKPGTSDRGRTNQRVKNQAEDEDPEPEASQAGESPLADLDIPPLAEHAGYKPPVPDLAGLLQKHPLKVGG